MALQQMLRALCLNTGWCYAVFWKLKRRSRMVLTWEDGYYDHIKPNLPFNNGLPSSAQKTPDSVLAGSNGCLEIGGNPLEQGVCQQERNYLSEQIGLTVAKMSYQVYSLGEGIIGRVAFTGKQQWVFSTGEGNSIEANSCGSTVQLTAEKIQYPAEWQNQFAAGIKTITVIAVSQGVVQLGSTQMIVEDPGWVDEVRSMFGTLQGVPEAFPSDLVSNMQKPKGHGQFVITFPPASSSAPGIGRRAVNRLIRPPVCNGKGGATTYLEGFENIHATKAIAIEPEPVTTSGKETSFPNRHPILPQPSAADIIQSGHFPISTMFPKLQLQGRSDALRSMWNGQEQVVPVVEGNKQPILKQEFKGLPQCGKATQVVGPMPVTSYALEQCLGEAFTNNGHENGSNSGKKLQSQLQSWMPMSFSDHLENRGNNNGCKLPMGRGVLFPPVLDREGDSTIETLARAASSSCASQPLLQKTLPGCHNGVGQFDELENLLASSVKEFDKAWDTSFVIGDELSQALGPAFQKKSGGGFWEELLMKTSEETKETTLQNLVEPSVHVTCPSGSGMAQSFACSSGREESSKLHPPLLDSGAPSLQAMGDNFSCMSALSGIDSSMSDISPKLELAAATLKASNDHRYPSSFLQGFEKLEKMPCLPITMVATNSEEKDTPKSNSASILFSALMEESQGGFKSETSQQSTHTKKSEESGKGSSRKRARPGESGRPRPKDRQQIQDRVRELREIVPNGLKCSIDSLLEKTIKHMLFLQGVTRHADVLKQSGDIKSDTEGGTSGALELCGHEIGLPIIVENLKQPCQMLVEMLCEERGFFLEIADTIRGLGLTILKGIIESRSDKVWARFIVEATMEVRRVDIVFALTQLLRPPGTSQSDLGASVPLVQRTSNGHTNVVGGFQQTSSSSSSSLPLLHANTMLP